MTQTATHIIDASTLRNLLKTGEITLVDVREPGEYASERIPGAQLESLSDFQPENIERNSDEQIVLYCQSGKRSQQALERCLKAGLTDVSSLESGLSAWKNAGYKTEKDKNAPISLFRQVQIVAGSLVFIGTVLGAFVSSKFLILSGFVGAGLVFAGITNTCAMGMLLAKLPYNQRKN